MPESAAYIVYPELIETDPGIYVRADEYYLKRIEESKKYMQELETWLSGLSQEEKVRYNWI